MSHEQTVKSVQSVLTEYSDVFDAKLNGLEAKFQEFEQCALTGATGGQMKTGNKSIASALLKSDNFKAFRSRELKSVAMPLDRELKNLVNDGAGSTSDDGYGTHPQRELGLYNDPRRPLSLLDALPTIQVNSATYEFVQLNAYTNSAAEQGVEGETKAQTALPTDVKSVRHATIAHWMPAAEQVLSDVPGLDSQIASLLRYGVLAKAEQLIVKGDGDIKGLEQIGAAFSGASGEDLATAISRAEAHLASTGWRGSHVVLNPTDWHNMRTQKRGASDDAFVVGSWMSPPSLNAWGMQVITTPSVTAGTSIVLDASQVRILDRMSALVEFFREDATNVRQNLVTIRAEARLGFACYAPSAVQLVTLV